MKEILTLIFFFIFFIFLPAEVLFARLLPGRKLNLPGFGLRITQGLVMLILIMALLESAGLPRSSIYVIPAFSLLMLFLLPKARFDIFQKYKDIRPSKVNLLVFWLWQGSVSYL